MTPSVTLKHKQSETCNVADISITNVDDLDIVHFEPESHDCMNDEDKWEMVGRIATAILHLATAMYNMLIV